MANRRKTVEEYATCAFLDAACISMIYGIVMYSSLVCGTLPERDLDPQIAVNGDGEESQDGALSEDEHNTGDHQTAVKVRLQSGANCYGQGNDKSPDRDVCQS